MEQRYLLRQLQSSESSPSKYLHNAEGTEEIVPQDFKITTNFGEVKLKILKRDTAYVPREIL